MAAELRAKEVRRPIHRQRRIDTSGRTLTTNVSMCEAFRSYFQEFFNKETGLSPAQVDTYLAYNQTRQVEKVKDSVSRPLCELIEAYRARIWTKVFFLFFFFCN